MQCAFSGDAAFFCCSGGRWYLHRDYSPQAQDNNSHQAKQAQNRVPQSHVRSLTLASSLRRALREPSDWKSCHSNTEKCTRMTKCRQRCLEVSVASKTLPFSFWRHLSFIMHSGQEGITRALFHGKTACKQRSWAELEVLMLQDLDTVAGGFFPFPAFTVQ